MTTKELHEAKMIDRAFDAVCEKIPLLPPDFAPFKYGWRAGYDEGLKWADNKKQIAAVHLRDMLQLYQDGKRGLPSFAELMRVLRLVEGNGEAPAKEISQTEAAAMLREDVEALMPAPHRARLISRLQARIDDPMWPDQAAVPKKLLEECLSALVNPLNE